MKGIVDRLASARVTVALLVALATLFGIGLVVPQKLVLQRELYEQWRARAPGLVSALEWVGLTDVHRSVLATGIWGAFFLQLGLVMVRRAPGTFRRVRMDADVPDPATATGLTFRTTIPAGAGALERALEFFRERGYAVVLSAGRVRAVRHRFFALASIAFHLSFFLVAAGAAISDATHFEGTVDLGEGEEFTGALAQYSPPPRLPRIGRPPTPRFTVEGITPEAVGDVPVGLRVHLRDERFASHVLEVNHPYRTQGMSFVFRTLGIAPALVMTDPDGATVFVGLMRLDVLNGRTDSFGIGRLRFEARFFPDYAVEDGVERSRGLDVRDPVLRLTARSNGGQAVSAALRPGDSVAFGPYRVQFVDWHYWVRLFVRYERGLWFIWLGFGIGVGALAGRLLLYRREFVLAEAGPGAGLVLGGRAEYYRALFDDEARAVARDLERVLRDPSPPPPVTGP